MQVFGKNEKKISIFLHMSEKSSTFARFFEKKYKSGEVVIYAILL